MKVRLMVFAILFVGPFAQAERIKCENSTHVMNLFWSKAGYVMHLVDKKSSQNNGVMAANYIIGGFEGAMGSYQSDGETFSVFSAADFKMTLQDATPSTGRPLNEEVRLLEIALHTVSNGKTVKDTTTFNPTKHCTISELEKDPLDDGMLANEYKNSFNKEDL